MQSTLAILDWVIIFIYFAIILFVAWKVTNQQKQNSDEYFLAGRNLSWFVVGASIFAFIVYAYDKSSAQNDRWRTPESHLHLLSLIGGWPGALYAQHKLRHKSSKKAFKQVYWATVVINIGVFFWLLSDKGQQFLVILFSL